MKDLSREIFYLTYKILRKIFGEKELIRKYPFSMARDFLLSKSKANFAIIQGHKMFLDKKDSLDLSINKVYESNYTEFVKRTIKKGDIVVDIGAHVGYYTLIFAKLVGEEGKVFAFEPNPENFSVLEKNVKINKYKNIILINKAVSDKNGRENFYLSDKNSGMHTLYQTNKNKKVIQVDKIRIDKYLLGKTGKIDFVKIDIEGMEYNALKGLGRFLNYNEIKIMSEFNKPLITDAGNNPMKFLKFMKKRGFNFFAVDNTFIRSKKPGKPLNLKDMMKKDFRNIIFSKKLNLY